MIKNHKSDTLNVSPERLLGSFLGLSHSRKPQCGPRGIIEELVRSPSQLLPKLQEQPHLVRVQRQLFRLLVLRPSRLDRLLADRILDQIDRAEVE